MWRQIQVGRPTCVKDRTRGMRTQIPERQKYPIKSTNCRKNSLLIGRKDRQRRYRLNLDTGKAGSSQSNPKPPAWQSVLLQQDSKRTRPPRSVTSQNKTKVQNAGSERVAVTISAWRASSGRGRRTGAFGTTEFVKILSDCTESFLFPSSRLPPCAFHVPSPSNAISGLKQGSLNTSVTDKVPPYPPRAQQPLTPSTSSQRTTLLLETDDPFAATPPESSQPNGYRC